MSLKRLYEAVHQSRIGNGDDRGSFSGSIGGGDASIELPLNNDLIGYRNPNSLNRLYTLMSTNTSMAKGDYENVKTARGTSCEKVHQLHTVNNCFEIYPHEVL